MADTPESKLKKEINKYLDSLGPDCWHAPYHNMGYGKAGTPDRLVCYRGKFLALEAKAPKKEPTAWQEREINNILKAGGVALAVWSVDDVKRAIRHIDFGTPLALGE